MLDKMRVRRVFRYYRKDLGFLLLKATKQEAWLIERELYLLGIMLRRFEGMTKR